MTRKTHRIRIRRLLTAIALSAVGALFLVPLAQARLDDYATSVGREASLTQFSDHILDVSARDSVLVPASLPSDHILDVSARDAAQAPSSEPNLNGDYMFQQYFRDQAKANDHILDVSARDDRSSTAISPEPTSGTDWQQIGIGAAMTLGGALLLVVLVAVGLEVRHSRQRLGSA